MTLTRRFQCHACGFSVFNRRLPNCEKCKAPLPATFLFKPEELHAIEAEHVRLDRMRRDLALEEAERERVRTRRRES